MAQSTTLRTPSRGAQYATLIAALLGWMFDGFEMGLFPLIGNPALKELLADDESQAGLEAASLTDEELKVAEKKRTDMVNQWFGVIMAVFLVGAASGGVLFGWLRDRRQRRAGVDADHG